MKKFTPKQTLFIAEYLVDLNATQAAIRAGYSKRTAKQQSSRLLTNVDVKAEISKRMEKRSNKLEISAERVLQEIAKLAFANIADYTKIDEHGQAYVDLSALTRDQAAAIQEITVDQYAGGGGDGEREQVKRTRFKLADKGLNLERLGRNLKLFTDKREVTGEDGAPVQTQVIVKFVQPNG